MTHAAHRIAARRAFTRQSSHSPAPITARKRAFVGHGGIARSGLRLNPRPDGFKRAVQELLGHRRGTARKPGRLRAAVPERSGGSALPQHHGQVVSQSSFGRVICSSAISCRRCSSFRPARLGRAGPAAAWLASCQSRALTAFSRSAFAASVYFCVDRIDP